MKKVKFGMRSAYLILASVFLILVNLTLGLVLTNVSQKALIAQIEGRMLDIANTAADMINGDELERLTKNDVETKEFQDVVNTRVGGDELVQGMYGVGVAVATQLRGGGIRVFVEREHLPVPEHVVEEQYAAGSHFRQE